MFTSYYQLEFFVQCILKIEHLKFESIWFYNHERSEKTENRVHTNIPRWRPKAFGAHLFPWPSP